MNPTEKDAVIRALQRLADQPDVPLEDPRLLSLVIKIAKQQKALHRRKNHEKERDFDRHLIEESLLVQREPKDLQNPEPGLILPEAATSKRSTRSPIRCYICKEPFHDLHFHYHRLCPPCAKDNYLRREPKADLSGRIALLTGGRIKIGYQTALALLRLGAKTILTTRFPKDALQRFSFEPDFRAFQERLSIVGLDLRSLPEIERFAQHLEDTEPHLDILIHNAAQTIRRPLAFFRHLLDGEAQPLSSIPAFLRSSLRDADFRSLGGHAPHTPHKGLASPLTPEPPPHHTHEPPTRLPALHDLFPPGRFDAHGQQIDLRHSNSWTQTFEEVETSELLEVHVINSFAPFLLNQKLKPLLLRSPATRRFVIHVTAMEGQFSRHSKPSTHPHTNMAKASLNMMTRTAAPPLAQEGIYMVSVDPGWSSQENPYPKGQAMRDSGFVPPLDFVDSAARILHPILEGLDPRKPPIFGIYLKDYKPFPW